MIDIKELKNEELDKIAGGKQGETTQYYHSIITIKKQRFPGVVSLVKNPGSSFVNNDQYKNNPNYYYDEETKQYKPIEDKDKL